MFLREDEEDIARQHAQKFGEALDAHLTLAWLPPGHAYKGRDLSISELRGRPTADNDFGNKDNGKVSADS